MQSPSSVCPSVRPFPLNLSNRLTFGLNLLHVCESLPWFAGIETEHAVGLTSILDRRQFFSLTSCHPVKYCMYYLFFQANQINKTPDRLIVHLIRCNYVQVGTQLSLSHPYHVVLVNGTTGVRGLWTAREVFSRSRIVTRSK